jgi:hypothetical protein
LESGKTLNHTKIVQINGEGAANGNKELDVKSENKQVSKLKGSFMLATKSDIVEISDDVLNLSTTDVIIEQYLVDTKSEFLCHKIIVLIMLVIKKSYVAMLFLYLCHN